MVISADHAWDRSISSPYGSAYFKGGVDWRLMLRPGTRCSRVGKRSTIGLRRFPTRETS